MDCRDLTPQDEELFKKIAESPCRDVLPRPTMVGYFDLPEVSSSDLGQLKRTFYGLPDNRAELEAVFNFGNLVDAMLTEQHLILYNVHGLKRIDGSIIYFETDVWLLAMKLARALAEDPVIKLLLPWSVGQYIFRRTLDFIYEDVVHQIRAKCKYDLFARKLKTGLDFKTTSCTTYAQFVESIDFFDYDKQAAWYMDLGRVNHYWIAGISKKNGKPFKFVIERGDVTHKRGVEKYSQWAYRWNMLVSPFSETLKLIA